MKPAALLGRIARELDRTPAGRRAGLAVYRALSALAARHLMTLPGVLSVYLTGSVARGDVDLGYSDVDLVVVADLPSDAAERTLLERLARAQERAAPLGGLFYNLDCLDVRELPYSRAFGAYWEMRLDGEGRRLAGERLIVAPTARPAREIAAERFSSALRRWVNTGARLLDPDIRADREANARDARRLATDIAAHATASGVRAGEPTRNSDGDANHDLAHAFAVLDVFAAQVSEPFSGSFRTTGAPPRFDLPASLSRLSTTLLGDPVRGIALLARGARDVVPVVVTEAGAPPAATITEVRRRFASARAELRELRALARRPVPLSPSMWRALALLEPAPFAGAAAASPLFVAGDVPPPPPAPEPALSDALLRARIVQSFAQCRGPSLRPKLTPAERERQFSERFALLDALDRAVDTGVLDVSFPEAPAFAKSADLRTEALRAFSAHHRRRLAPLLAARNVQ